MGRALKSFAEEKYMMNLREYDFHYRHLEKLVTNMFTWENLPDTISSRFIEDTLFHNGMCVFYRNNKKILTVSKAVSNYLNNQDEPSEFTCYSNSTLENASETRSISTAVPIFNNTLMQGSCLDVSYFASKLTNIDRAIDVNLENIKQPFLIIAPEGQEISARKLMQKRSNGEPFILAYEDSIKNIEIKPFNFDIKNYTKELAELKQNTMSEALTYFGINNVNISKRERLTSGETEQNNEQIGFNNASMYNMRKLAEEKINDMFKCNIKVVRNIEVCREVERYVHGTDK